MVIFVLVYFKIAPIFQNSNALIRVVFSSLAKDFFFVTLLSFMNLLYLDPGSSSYLIQAIAAGALGALFFVKNFWYSIKAFFTGKKKNNDASEDDIND
jgi:hypothetical protein